MIEERALVVAIDNQIPGQPLAYLEVERKTACGLCGKTRGCGNQIWGKLLAHQQARFSANNSIHAQVGQSVIIAIDEKAVMYAALLLYLLPLITMLVFACLFSLLLGGDLYAVCGAALGLVLAWLWVKGFLAVRPHGFARPEVVRLVTENCVTFHNG